MCIRSRRDGGQGQRNEEGQEEQGLGAVELDQLRRAEFEFEIGVEQGEGVNTLHMISAIVQMVHEVREYEQAEMAAMEQEERR